MVHDSALQYPPFWKDLNPVLAGLVWGLKQTHKKKGKIANIPITISEKTGVGRIMCVLGKFSITSTRLSRGRERRKPLGW